MKHGALEFLACPDCHADLLEQWFPARVHGDWSVGAALQFTFPPGQADDLPGEDLRGQVLAFDPPRLLEFQWGKHVIKFELVDAGEACAFRLSEGFGDPSWGAKSATGWEMCLENLDLILEGVGASKFTAHVWRTKYRAYAAQFEPDFGPQEDPSHHDPLFGDDE
jgi:hypothetical protein